MASSYSTDLKLELMVTGENAGTWGDKTNTNLNLIQQAIAGVESIALSDGGDVTLVMTDATISNARNMVLKLTGTLTGASTLSIPDSIEKFYIIDATSVTGPTNLTVKTVSGSGFTLDAAKIYACYSNGTDVIEVSLDTLGGTVGTASIADASITTAKISDAVITSAKISDNQITTAKISDNQITTAKISDNQVTAAKLDDVFGGTPGEFTAATVTVDAQGRITAASSGSGGAGGFKPNIVQNGANSGTATSNGNEILVYAVSGGGGGSGGIGSGQRPGGAGGPGFMAAFSAPITPPFSQPYSIGAGGNGGAGGVNAPGPVGGSGGATSLTNIFSINGASPGNPAVSPGAPGNTGSTGSIGSGTAFYSTGNPAYRIYTGSGSGTGGNRGEGASPRGNAGGAGSAGFMALFDNTAT